MKNLLLLLTATALFGITACSKETLSPATSAYPPDYELLLKTYVTPEGVKYDDWKANKEDIERLKNVVAFYSSTTPPADRNASFAWHLNAYNAWILQNILAKFPTKGPLENDATFFDAESLSISGKKMSFNALEQKTIRPTFQDPRVHFALNCASRSCPPLLGKPFDPRTLDKDLDQLAVTFINSNPRGIVITPNSVQFSKIFDWYAEDFGGKGKQRDFVNRFRKAPLPADAKIEFSEYDWALNQAP